MSRKQNKELLVQQQDDILVIKINRPYYKNALNRRAVYELIAAVEGATNNSLIKLIVLTAVGDYFTAGNDLQQIKEYEQPEYYFRGANYVLRALTKTFMACTKLLVCLINGPCIGIGFTLAALSDVVYCTKNAYFQAPFSQLGLCAEACSSLTFPQQFGVSWSTKLLIFGEKLTAEKAEQLGFVVEIIDNLQLETFWTKMQVYAKLPKESMRITKALIKLNNKDNLIHALNAELKAIDKLRHGDVYQLFLEQFINKSLNKSKL